jgi:ribosomal protein S14
MRKNSTTKQRCKSRIEGRARSVNTFTGLARFPLRFLAGDGFFKGVVR